MPFVVHSIDLLSGKTSHKSFKTKSGAIKHMRYKMKTGFTVSHLPRSFEYVW
jgi:hypothetical protein